MIPLPKYITGALLDDLWGDGFTLTRRNSDPLHVPSEIIPQGMSYQWNLASARDEMAFAGWVEVNYERHPGVFGRYDLTGPITYGGLVLMEKFGAHEAERKRQIDAVAKQETDWAKKFARDGVSLCATVTRDGTVRQIGTPFAEQATKIPRNLMDRAPELFAIRDQILGTAPAELAKDARVRAAATDLAIIALQTKPTGA